MSSLEKVVALLTTYPLSLPPTVQLEIRRGPGTAPAIAAGGRNRRTFLDHCKAAWETRISWPLPSSQCALGA
jgi:hypothetical protein